jgi:hypothetical protein
VTGGEAAFRSYKFRRCGLRYEIGICILTGWICWLFGPLPAGDWPDVEIFRLCLKHMLEDKERVEADDGYVGENPSHVKVPCSHVHGHDEKMLLVRTKVRRRHETANYRIKEFKAVGSKDFRQDLEYHGICFRAATVLTQLSIENGRPLFDVSADYQDPPPFPPPPPTIP